MVQKGTKQGFNKWMSQLLNNYQQSTCTPSISNMISLRHLHQYYNIWKCGSSYFLKRPQAIYTCGPSVRGWSGLYKYENEQLKLGKHHVVIIYHSMLIFLFNIFLNWCPYITIFNHFSSTSPRKPTSLSQLFWMKKKLNGMKYMVGWVKVHKSFIANSHHIVYYILLKICTFTSRDWHYKTMDPWQEIDLITDLPVKKILWAKLQLPFTCCPGRTLSPYNQRFFHLVTITLSFIDNFILGSSEHGGQHPVRKPLVIGNIEPL